MFVGIYRDIFYFIPDTGNWHCCNFISFIHLFNESTFDLGFYFFLFPVLFFSAVVLFPSFYFLFISFAHLFVAS